VAAAEPALLGATEFLGPTGADINLVAQDHLLTISGAWRGFERHLQRHPGTLFAVQARYLADDDRRR
jgi:hypothetical protein